MKTYFPTVDFDSFLCAIFAPRKNQAKKFLQPIVKNQTVGIFVLSKALNEMQFDHYTKSMTDHSVSL
jgi:hypothetical protein